VGVWFVFGGVRGGVVLGSLVGGCGVSWGGVVWVVGVGGGGGGGEGVVFGFFGAIVVVGLGGWGCWWGAGRVWGGGLVEVGVGLLWGGGWGVFGGGGGGVVGEGGFWVFAVFVVRFLPDSSLWDLTSFLSLFPVFSSTPDASGQALLPS